MFHADALYIPAKYVDRITEDEIRLTITKDKLGEFNPWNTPRALIAGKALVLSSGAARGLPWAGVVSSMPVDALESERLFVDGFTAWALRAGRALLIGERTAKLEVGLRQTRRAAQLDRLTREQLLDCLQLVLDREGTSAKATVDAVDGR